MWGPFGILTALGLALAPVAGSAQTDQTETPTSVEAQTVSALPRNITLSELGFSSGITFTGLFGDAEMFFPLPDPAAVIEAELVLQIEHAETSDGDRFFQVLIGDRLVATVDLDKRRSPTEVRIPVSPSLARGGFLETRIRYSGALSDRICVDERASGDFFLVDAESHLELALDPDALDRPDLVAGFQPPHVHVSLPDGDVTAAALTAALRAGTIYNAQNGLVTYGAIPDDLAPIWTRADLEIAEAGSVTGFAAGLQAVANRRADRPALVLSGNDPQRALDVVAGPWAGSAGVAPLFTDGLTPRSSSDQGLSFDALGFDTRPKTSSGQTQFDFAFDIAQIPVGRQISSVSLLISSAVVDEDRDATAVAFLNDTILGSTTLSGGEPTWLDVDVPQGLVARDNLLRVQILRQQEGGECTYASQPYPSQVLPGSQLNLSAESGPPQDFHDLRQAMQRGVDLLIDPDLETRDPELFAWMLPAVASLVPPSARFRPVEVPLAEEGADPFIVISTETPAGSDPRLRLDSGVVELRSAEGEVLFTGADLGRLGTVQIIDIGTRRGLWLRPGTGASPKPTQARPLILDQGDVALLNEEGVVVATSTARPDLLRVVYPGRSDLFELFNRYRPWIIGAIWLFVTLLVLQILRRTYAAQRAEGGGD